MSTNNLMETVSVYPSTSTKLGCVVYIHGGGLVFGSRDDLPQPYVSAFNTAGFDLIAIDYPLAPQYTLADILPTLESTLDVLRASGQLDGEFLTLFGRSAGAFLVLQLQARAIQRGEPLADRIISLYGYADMQDPAFRQPSAFYQGFGAVDPLPENPADSDFVSRFSLYVGLRQRGTWPDVVIGEQDVAIPDEILREMPPTFLAASAYDPDVPFGCSKRLATTIPLSRFHRIYDCTEHDVDRDPSSPHGLPLYREIIDWLSTP